MDWRVKHERTRLPLHFDLLLIKLHNFGFPLTLKRPHLAFWPLFPVFFPSTYPAFPFPKVITPTQLHHNLNLNLDLDLIPSRLSTIKSYNHEYTKNLLSLLAHAINTFHLGFLSDITLETQSL